MLGRCACEIFLLAEGKYNEDAEKRRSACDYLCRCTTGCCSRRATSLSDRAGVEVARGASQAGPRRKIVLRQTAAPERCEGLWRVADQQEGKRLCQAGPASLRMGLPQRRDCTTAARQERRRQCRHQHCEQL